MKVQILILGAVASALITLALVRPQTGESMPESIVIPMLKARDAGDPDAAVFSHWAHNTYQCYDCHPAIFPQGKAGFTHDDMDAGRFCGTCHNDKVTWSPDDADIECEFCHRE